MSDLKPPVDNSFVLSFAKTVLPLALAIEQIDVRASAHCITSIRRLPGQTVIMVNHSDRSDPTSLFTLARLCNEDFYYLAARELFDENFGFRGWMLQRCGAYSVVRGDPPDVESKEKTISLIAEGRRKLVMFPEGDVSGRDDFIRPLKEDGIRNIFEAQRRRLEKSGGPVRLLPVAAYYQVTDDAFRRMNDCISRLEAQLALPAVEAALQSKIRRLVTAAINHLERYYGAEPEDGLALEPRLRILCKRVTTAVAAMFNIEADMDDEAVRLYSVRGKLRLLPHRPHSDYCGFCLRLAQSGTHRRQACVHDLETMQQLLILASTLEQPLSAESAWRIVDRLELLVTGRLTGKGRRVVWLEAAAPIDLRDFMPASRQDDEGAVKRIDCLVREGLLEVLRELKQSMAGERVTV